MGREKGIDLLNSAKMYDLTQALSIFTPPFPGEMPLQVHFFKRLTGSFGGGQGAKTGLYAVRAVLTPDRKEKRQNGRRMKEDGEPSFTLTGQDQHGVYLSTDGLTSGL